MPLRSYKDFLHRCFRCGYCKFSSAYTDFNCPSYNRFRRETYSPGGRLWLIRAVAEKQIPPSRHYADILYSCTMCGNCRAHCCLEFREEILNMVTAARAELVDASILPPTVQKYLENIYTFNNAWKKSPKKRDAWTKGTGIRRYEKEDRYLFHVGDIGSYHPRTTEVCRALGRLLLRSGVRFGILGSAEVPAGNEVRDMGETALFEYLKEKNIDQFRENRVQNIIAYSPHSYHAMKHHYPEMSDSISVFHYLETVNQILSEGRIHLKERTPTRVTYHDSCLLGRWNGIYELPREVLRRVPNLELVEMERNRSDALCCGGGNGNLFTDMLGGDSNSPGRVRIREALSCGAEIIAVSCPICLIMLEDAVEGEGVAHRIKVKDISEIIASAAGATVQNQENQHVRSAV